MAKEYPDEVVSGVYRLVRTGSGNVEVLRRSGDTEWRAAWYEHVELSDPHKLATLIEYAPDHEATIRRWAQNGRKASRANGSKP